MSFFCFFVFCSETGFSGMQTPAARLSSRPKRWLMCVCQRVRTFSQKNKKNNSSSTLECLSIQTLQLRQFETKKSHKTYVPKEGGRGGRHIGCCAGFYLSREMGYSVCLSASPRGDISRISMNDCPVRACCEKLLTGERELDL